MGTEINETTLEHMTAWMESITECLVSSTFRSYPQSHFLVFSVSSRISLSFYERRALILSKTIEFWNGLILKHSLETNDNLHL